jgi:hypothetical protein
MVPDVPSKFYNWMLTFQSQIIVCIIGFHNRELKVILDMKN